MTKTYSESEYDIMIADLLRNSPSFGSVGKAAYKPGLERMRRVCAIMGEPQDKYPSIHIAGTNGKGSTANMLASVLQGCGLKVGLYTSPHILDFRERIRTVSGGVARLIPKEAVWEFLTSYASDIRSLELSFFELTTAMAFKFFADEKVDVAVIETGLGGRLDATNVLTPVLSVITNIGYDHMDILGHSLPQIAAEKAGIIKKSVPVVIGESSPETDGVFESRALECSAPLFFADRNGNSGIAATLLPRLDLLGCYQEKNLLTVLTSLDVMQRFWNGSPRFFADGALVLDAVRSLERAAHICRFHARWEKICSNPLTICDIGHNEHGLKYNFSQLETMLERGEVSDIVMVYGSVSDKDVDAVLRILPKRAYVYFTAAASPRAMSAGELRKRADHPDSEVVADVKDAVRAALGKCSSMEHPILYIGGSTYVVAEAYSIFVQ